MYVILVENTDIYNHFELIDNIYFTTYEKAEEYLLKGVEKWKHGKQKNEYIIYGCYAGVNTYFIEKLEIINVRSEVK